MHKPPRAQKLASTLVLHRITGPNKMVVQRRVLAMFLQFFCAFMALLLLQAASMAFKEICVGGKLHLQDLVPQLTQLYAPWT